MIARFSAMGHPPGSFRTRRELVRVLHGLKNSQDGQLLLSWLANVSGYYRVDSVDLSDAHMRYNNGKRSVFAALVGHLRMTEAELSDLEEAARQEFLADSGYGEF